MGASWPKFQVEVVIPRLHSMHRDKNVMAAETLDCQNGKTVSPVSPSGECK